MRYDWSSMSKVWVVCLDGISTYGLIETSAHVVAAMTLLVRPFLTSIEYLEIMF